MLTCRFGVDGDCVSWVRKLWSVSSLRGPYDSASDTILSDIFSRDNTSYFDSSWGGEDDWVGSLSYGRRSSLSKLSKTVSWLGSEMEDGRIPFTVLSTALHPSFNVCSNLRRKWLSHFCMGNILKFGRMGGNITNITSKSVRQSW